MSIPDALRRPRPVLINVGSAVTSELAAARWFQVASGATAHIWVVPHAGSDVVGFQGVQHLAHAEPDP